MKLYPACAFVLLVALFGPAHAYDGTMDAFISQSNSNMMITNSIVGGAVTRSTLKRQLNVQGSGTSSKSSPSQANKNSGTPASALQFKRSAAVQEQSKSIFFSQMRKLDPAGAALMQARYADRDLFQALDQSVTGYGLRTDNIADAFAFWMIHLWMGSNGVSEDPPIAHIKAVRNQLVLSMQKSPMYAEFDQETKQLFAERLILNAAALKASTQDPRLKTAQDKAALQSTIAKVGTQLGLDLRTVRITNNGFEPR
jgi:hypothetical protein